VSPGLGHTRCAGAVAGLIGLALLAGCASRVQVQSLATGDGRAVYELRGSHLAILHAEARGLCPQGAEVLRQWQRHERDEAEPGRLWRWTSDLVDAPRNQAQLQISCRA